METTPNIVGTQRSPPCAQCRQKKIKCNKLQPCENCRKAGLECTYQESNNALSSAALESNSLLQERVSQLEAQLQAVTALLRVSPRPDTNTPNSSTSPASNKTTDQSSTLLECHCGRQILGSNSSVHYDYYIHWIELFPKLRDTYLELIAAEEEADGPKEVSQLYLGSTLGGFPSLHAYHPANAEADLLIKAFFENVDPFVRVLNKEAFFSDLSKFRMGRLAQPASFNALLFSIYGLAVSSLHPSETMQTLGLDRDLLLNQFHEAQELALRQSDFINSNKLPVFQAFLFYLVFLFARGYYRTATSLVGLAARIAQRLGLHKDPSYFTYSSWVAEWRRRLWNQLILLDQKAITLQGAISMLSFAWDTQLPENISDKAWNTSPFAKPSDAPQKATGAFSQMTPMLAKRKTLAVLCPLRQNMRKNSYEELISHIETGLQGARQLFVVVDDDDDEALKHLASFAYIVMELDFAALRLMAGQAHIRFGQATAEFKLQNFLGALEILERITSLEAEVTNPGWMWTFYADNPPLLPVAMVLLHLISAPDTPYAARAWTQINIMFDKYLCMVDSRGISSSSHPSPSSLSIPPSLASFPSSSSSSGLSASPHPPILAALESLRDMAQSRYPLASTSSASIAASSSSSQSLNLGGSYNNIAMNHQSFFDSLLTGDHLQDESFGSMLSSG